MSVNSKIPAEQYCVGWWMVGVCLALHYPWALGKRRQRSGQAAPSTRQMVPEQGGREREGARENEKLQKRRGSSGRMFVFVGGH